MALKVYVPTPGINIPLSYGSTLGPILGDMLLSLLRQTSPNITGNILLNCHTPHFKEYPEVFALDNLIDQRLEEYKRIKITKRWNFFRDDQVTDRTNTSVKDLLERKIIFLEQGDLFINLNRLKEEALKKVDNVFFYPHHYRLEFIDYLKKTEQPRLFTAKLSYGCKLDDLGFDNLTLGQVWEQVLFASETEQELAVISGPNVLGPYTYPAIALHLFKFESPVYVLTHSLASLGKAIPRQRNRKNQLTLEMLLEENSELIEASDYLRCIAGIMYTGNKIRVIDENERMRARKMIIKYENLLKVKPTITHSVNIKDIPDAIEFCFGIFNRTFSNILKISKQYAKGSFQNNDWEQVSQAMRLFKGI